MQEVDFGVLIGRFQPFHYGHLRLIKDAMPKVGKLLILIGSSNRPRLERNPFTFEERAKMIRETVFNAAGMGHQVLDRIEIRALPDRIYDHSAWLAEVQHILQRCTGAYIRPSVGLFGHRRDHTSEYLNDFPDWVDLCIDDLGSDGLEATHIRNRYFSEDTAGLATYLPKVVPDQVVTFLSRFRQLPEFDKIRVDRKANADYKVAWGSGPHTTADSVVLRSGRILLVKRKEPPLKGLWALPGGFLDIRNGETLYGCATRELSEETLIDLIGDDDVEDRTAAILRSAYRGRDVFDDPHRSERARIITVAHLFDLGSGFLPPVCGADDAAEAEWVPLTQVRADTMFDDHAFIVSSMLSRFQGKL